MQITDIRLRLLKKETHGLLAFATIILDNALVIEDFRILKTSNGVKIAMPSKKLPDGTYKDVVFPISTSLNEHITEKVLTAYEDEINKL